MGGNPMIGTILIIILILILIRVHIFIQQHRLGLTKGLECLVLGIENHEYR